MDAQGRADAAPIRRETVWQTDAGEVRISYPEPLAMFDVEFLEEFVALWLRGVRRRAVATEDVDAITPASDGEALATEPKLANAEGGGE